MIFECFSLGMHSLVEIHNKGWFNFDTISQGLSQNQNNFWCVYFKKLILIWKWNKKEIVSHFQDNKPGLGINFSIVGNWKDF